MDAPPAMQHPIQVQADAAYGRRYLTLARMITHWHQADCVATAAGAGGSVLEIGPGAGHTSWLLRHWGLQVTTLDFDPGLKPDIVGDITRLPCADGAFDCVLAAEVLEHLPFAEVETALRELRRVARRQVVVSVPAPFAGLSVLLNVAGLQPRGLFLGMPYRVKHVFDGQHHWELGKRGTSVARFRALVQGCGFKVLRAFRPAPSLYAYFFVLDAHPR